MLYTLLVGPIENLLERFSKEVFNTFASHFCLNLLKSLILLWLLLLLYQTLWTAELSLKELFKKIIIFICVGAALSSQKNLYWDYVHEPIKLVSENVVEAMISSSPQSTHVPIQGSRGMIDALENAMGEVGTLLWEASTKCGLKSIIIAPIAMGVFILFLVSEAVFSLYLIGSMIKLATLGALSPFLMIAFAFEPTKTHAISAIKYVITSVLQLVIASFCIALLLLVLRELLLQKEVLLAKDVFVVISTMGCLSLVSLYFLLIGPEMAATIMGSQSGAVLPAIIGGAMAYGAQYIFKKAGKISLLAGKAASLGAWSAGRTAAEKVGNKIQSVRERFSKNYQPETTKT